MIQHTLVNLGHATWLQPNSSGILVCDPAATIRNAKSAVWDAFDRQILVNNVAETGARFDNEGLFRVFGNAGGINFNPIAFNNHGSVSIEIYQFSNLGAVVSPSLPGAPVTPFHLTGNYTQGASATLAIDFAGTPPGTDFDQLTANIQANLAGTLAVTVAPSYQPAIGDRFRSLSTAQLPGKFTTVTTTGLASGRKLAIKYDSPGVTLTVVNGP